MDPFIGQINMFGGNFAPRGWALCDGQLLPIAQNSALFSILGTNYGGDGVTTFGLPDLRGRVPVHAGQGPGLTPRSLGQKGGAERVTLTAAQMPAHNDSLQASNQAGDSQDPANNYPTHSRGDDYTASLPGTVTMNPGVVTQTGSGQPHDNVQPFQCVNYIIALEGNYPSRN